MVKRGPDAQTRDTPTPPAMFASVGRGASPSGASGASLRTLLLFVGIGVAVALLDDWWRGPPPIRPVAVDMMGEEAAAAAAQVEAQGGLLPLPEEPELEPEP